MNPVIICGLTATHLAVLNVFKALLYMYYSNKIFITDIKRFSCMPYNSKTGGCGYVQNSGFSDCLKSTDCLDAVLLASGSRVQNQGFSKYERMFFSRR